MNSEINNQSNPVESANVTDANIHPINQVTPVSKYLAMALFIILPFVGGYVGYTFAPEKVVEVTVTPAVIITPSEAESFDVLVSVPVDAQHFLFEGRKTGYFSSNDKVYLAQLNGTVDTEVGEYDWVVIGPAEIVPEADAATFKVISSEPAQTGSLFAVDSERAYSFKTLLPNVDVTTVEIFGRGGAFLMSDKGLYIGDVLVTSAAKADVEVYVINATEALSPFHVYVHNLVSNTWLQGGAGLEQKEIPAPEASDLTEEFKLFPLN